MKEIEAERTCIKCNQSKPLTQEHFRIAKRYKDKIYFTHKCRKCTAVYCINVSKSYQRNNSEKHWITKTMTCAMKRARNCGVPFDREAVRQIAVNHKHGTPCPCCGISMSYFKNGTRRNWASLDRTYPEKGYIAGNLAFICYRCNLLKSNATIKELENILAYVKSARGLDTLNPNDTLIK